jgi:hypothetical protein
MNLIKIIFCLGILVTTGCSDYARASMTSGLVGCSPAELRIEDSEIGWQTDTWTANCNGKRFYCTYLSSYSLDNNVQCKEALK